MYKIATMNKISPKGLSTFGEKYSIIENPDQPRQESHRARLERGQELHQQPPARRLRGHPRRIRDVHQGDEIQV